MSGAVEPVLLIGCGILADEVRSVIAERSLPVSIRFLPPALHLDPRRLEGRLTGALTEHADRRRAVLYGACHPLMDDLVAVAGACRTAGQNCVEMLLGTEAFTEHLNAGAYFLLERWARGFEATAARVFGPYPEVVREIYRTSHRYLLAIRTPYSGDFTAAARSVSERVGLPLRWTDVGLEELGRRVEEAVRGACGAPGAAAAQERSRRTDAPRCPARRVPATRAPGS